MTTLDGDVYIGGEPYDVLDDVKMLRHVPCGEALFGDSAIADHVCEPVECPDCDGEGIVFDHVNYWGKAEDRNCTLCSGTGRVHPLVLA